MLVALGAVGVVAVGWVQFRYVREAAPVTAERPTQRDDWFSAPHPVPADPVTATAIAPTQPGLTPAQTRERLFRHGSLAGSSPTGDWCVRDGRLQPCEALRHRFEYYLLALGEVTAADLRALVADEVTRAHGSAPVADILSLWDRHLALRAHPYRTVFDPHNLATWRALLDEQQRVRRQMLGEAWAQAFFATEEAEAQRDLARLERGEPWPADPGLPVSPARQDNMSAPPPATHSERVARYGAAAADRLAQADARWADWTGRLQTAQTEWSRLQAAPELSPPQRRQAIDAHIRSHFRPDERRRVEALLAL